jgi:hypothetical protein
MQQLHVADGGFLCAGNLLVQEVQKVSKVPEVLKFEVPAKFAGTLNLENLLNLLNP